MDIVGPDSGSCCGGCTGTHLAAFTTTAPYAATVVVDYDFFNEDKGGGPSDWPVFLLDGSELPMGGLVTGSSCGGCVAIFDVPAGSTWGFGVHSHDCGAGPGVMFLCSLRFLPQTVGPQVAPAQPGADAGRAVAAAPDPGAVGRADCRKRRCIVVRQPRRPIGKLDSQQPVFFRVAGPYVGPLLRVAPCKQSRR